MDITMPEMDGYQVPEHLQQQDSLKHIPVIAVTANAMADDIERGKASGFADYLTKPLDIPLFIKTLVKHLPSKSDYLS